MLKGDISSKFIIQTNFWTLYLLSEFKTCLHVYFARDMHDFLPWFQHEMPTNWLGWFVCQVSKIISGALETFSFSGKLYICRYPETDKTGEACKISTKDGKACINFSSTNTHPWVSDCPSTVPSFSACSWFVLSSFLTGWLVSGL